MSSSNAPTTTRRSEQLRFLWWNVQSFAHYDPTQAGTNRWPSSAAEYLAKRDRVENVLTRVSRRFRPQILAFAEITDTAARDIRDRLFSTYKVHMLASLYPRDDYHLAVLYDPASGFQNEDFLVPTNVSSSTRPMAIIDHVSRGSRIRFYLCHWTAPFEEQSEKWRDLTALALNTAAYEYIRNGLATEQRHVVVLGDLNEEPFGLLESWLYASRDRRRARGREHYTDKPIHRLRLYNCAWRLLGEQFPHPHAENARESAGTYYWKKKKTWHTLDHVIVSGSLLSEAPPYLDEQSVRVACDLEEFPEDLLEDGLPCKFDWQKGNPTGVSDHLPLTGSIVLP